MTDHEESRSSVLWWMLGLMATVVLGLAAYTLTDIRSDVTTLTAQLQRLEARTLSFQTFVIRKLDYLDTLLQERGGRPFQPRDPQDDR